MLMFSLWGSSCVRIGGVFVGKPGFSWLTKPPAAHFVSRGHSLMAVVGTAFLFAEYAAPGEESMNALPYWPRIRCSPGSGVAQAWVVSPVQSLCGI